MKTTIEIADPLLREAKRLAARRRVTLRAVLESALRDTLAREQRSRATEPVRTVTFRGRGLQRGLSFEDWSAWRDLAYEGRGG